MPPTLQALMPQSSVNLWQMMPSPVPSILEFFLSLMASSSLIFMVSSNPLTLALTLVFLAITLGFLLSVAACKWMGLSLMMVFAGGMMVSFLYVTSLSFNLKFLIKANTFSMAALLALTCLLVALQLKTPSSPLAASLYLSWNSTLVAILVTYLLVTLVFVVKLSESFKGSLVQKF